MTSADRHERLAAAGKWLREQRERRGFATISEFANTLGVDKSLVSNYERGVNAVTDERAEQIADVLRIDILDVRRGLGLWVPESPEHDDQPEDEPDLEAMSDDELEDYIQSISEAHGEALVERHRRKAG